MKYCPRCGEIKPLEDFGIDPRSLDNRYRFCRPCERVRM